MHIVKKWQLSNELLFILFSIVYSSVVFVSFVLVACEVFLVKSFISPRWFLLSTFSFITIQQAWENKIGWIYIYPNGRKIIKLSVSGLFCGWFNESKIRNTSPHTHDVIDIYILIWSGVPSNKNTFLYQIHNDQWLIIANRIIIYALIECSWLIYWYVNEASEREWVRRVWMAVRWVSRWWCGLIK